MIFYVQRVGSPSLNRGGTWFSVIHPDNIFGLEEYEEMHRGEPYRVARISIERPFYFFCEGAEVDYPIELYAYLENTSAYDLKRRIDIDCENYATNSDISYYEDVPDEIKTFDYMFNECVEEYLSDIEAGIYEKMKMEGFDAVLFINNHSGMVDQIFYTGKNGNIKWIK